MILVTVGTNEQPFDRLVRAAARLRVDEPLVVQYGASREPHGQGTWVDFMSFDGLSRHVRDARVVVCHAGVGSIMLARRHGKVPIVVPRRLALREAVDDHQLPLARRLAEVGMVRLLEDESELAPALTTPAEAAPGIDALPGAADLAEDLRSYLERLVAA